MPDIQNLLNSPHKSLSHLLQSRALAKERIRRTFDIHSTFVSNDEKLHATFVKLTSSMLAVVSKHPAGWRHIQDLAAYAMGVVFVGQTIAFDRFFRSITFIVIAVGLMDADPNALNVNDVDFVTERISQLWDLSKKAKPISNRQLDDINGRLMRMIPDRDRFPNPLELVIPPWETLWRLLAMAFIHAHDNEQTRNMFAEFHANPTKAQFVPSVTHFMRETLRCHPPIRRITRAFVRQPLWLAILPSCLAELLETIYSPIVLETADIAAQKSPDFGDNAGDFDPNRYAHGSVPPLPAFGCGQLQCIAREWAPMAAAVILSTVLAHLRVNEYVIQGQHYADWDGWKITRK
jgi:cytochrome P450